MSYNQKSWWFWLGAAIGTSVMFVLNVLNQRHINNVWEKELVQRGFAHYKLDGDKAVWAWKDTTP